MTSISNVGQCDPADLSSAEFVRWKTQLAFLVGSREAILKLASSPQTVWLGLLFVMSAGFAREFDGVDLALEPWHLFLPLGASLVTSFLLFVLVYLLAMRRGARPKGFFETYRSFLGLYWMTAPLAWFYAIPVERFLTAAASVEANIWLLGIVSVWRVVLITRVLTVLFDARFETVFPLVMLFADSLMLFLIATLPKPIMSIMGGARLTESELVIANATFLMSILGTLTWPFWLLGTAIVFLCSVPAWSHPKISAIAPWRFDRTVWLTGICSILVWGLILPLTQPEQRLRSQVERPLKTGQLREAIDMMSAHQMTDFPPHWDPPPRSGYRDRLPRVVDIVEIVADRPDDWVRRLFMEKFRKQLNDYHFLDGPLGEMQDEERFRVLLALEGLLARGEFLTLTQPDSRLKSLLQSVVGDDGSGWHPNDFSPVSEKTREKAKVLLDHYFRPPRQ